MYPFLMGLIALVASAGTATVLYAFVFRPSTNRLQAGIAALEREATQRKAVMSGPYRLLEIEWSRLKARWHRNGERFALAVVELGDALHPQLELSPAVMAEVLCLIDKARRAEDYWFHVNARTVIVLLAGSSTDGGWAFAERLRWLLGNDPFPRRGGHTYVDVRVGVAEWSINLTVLTELIDAAGRARRDFSLQLRRQRVEFLPGRHLAGDG